MFLRIIKIRQIFEHVLKYSFVLVRKAKLSLKVLLTLKINHPNPSYMECQAFQKSRVGFLGS